MHSAKVTCPFYTALSSGLEPLFFAPGYPARALSRGGRRQLDERCLPDRARPPSSPRWWGCRRRRPTATTTTIPRKHPSLLSFTALSGFRLPAGQQHCNVGDDDDGPPPATTHVVDDPDRHPKQAAVATTTTTTRRCRNLCARAAGSPVRFVRRVHIIVDRAGVSALRWGGAVRLHVLPRARPCQLPRRAHAAARRVAAVVRGVHGKRPHLLPAMRRHGTTSRAHRIPHSGRQRRERRRRRRCRGEGLAADVGATGSRRQRKAGNEKMKMMLTTLSTRATPAL